MESDFWKQIHGQIYGKDKDMESPFVGQTVHEHDFLPSSEFDDAELEELKAQFQGFGDFDFDEKGVTDTVEKTLFGTQKSPSVSIQKLSDRLPRVQMERAKARAVAEDRKAKENDEKQREEAAMQREFASMFASAPELNSEYDENGNAGPMINQPNNLSFMEPNQDDAFDGQFDELKKEFEDAELNQFGNAFDDNAFDNVGEKVDEIGSTVPLSKEDIEQSLQDATSIKHAPKITVQNPSAAYSDSMTFDSV